MKLLSLLLALVFSVTAIAGFEGMNAGTSLNVFNRINCSTGVSCTRVKDKFTITSVNTGVLESQVAIATDTTATIAQCGSTFINSAAAKVNLPEASTALGCQMTFVTGLAANFDVNPDNADMIEVQTDVAGDMVRNAATGSSITIQAISGSQWAPISVTGTWSDAN